MIWRWPNMAPGTAHRLAMTNLGTLPLRPCRSLFLLFSRLAEGPLYHVVWVGRYRAVAPQPAHHLGHDRPAELLTVQVHAPCIVHVVTLFRKGLHQPYVLVEPVALLVVNAVAETAVVVPPIAQKNSDWLLFAGAHLLGVDVPTPEIDEATYVAQHLAEMVRTLPGNRECCNGT